MNLKLNIVVEHDDFWLSLHQDICNLLCNYQLKLILVFVGLKLIKKHTVFAIEIAF